MKDTVEKIVVGLGIALIIAVLLGVFLIFSRTSQEPTPTSPPAPKPSTVTVYTEDGQYIAKADSGKSIASDANDAAPVIQAAIDALPAGGVK